jgi:antibiotic biosynthesis monooxygenase (ABM) superfamily enzyme
MSACASNLRMSIGVVCRLRRKMIKPTLTEAIAELHRELTLRQRVYPGWVQSGKLSEAAAARQVARLEAAIAYLEAAQPQQVDLFTDDATRTPN